MKAKNTFRDLRKLKTEELLQEWESLEQQIHSIGCYGMFELKLRMAIENELIRRGYRAY